VREERKPRQNKRSKIQSQQHLISNRSLILGDFPDDPVALLAPVLLGSNLEDAKACRIYCRCQVYMEALGPGSMFNPVKYFRLASGTEHEDSIT